MRSALVWMCVALLAAGSVAAIEPAPPESAASGSVLGAEGRPGVAAEVQLSRGLLHELLRRDLHLLEPVSETIHGMTTRGTARVECHLGVEFVPDPRQAVIRLRMSGEAVVDDAVGRQRSVQVQSASRTRIEGSKDIHLSVEGLRIQPAEVGCRTAIDVQSVTASRRLVQRFAERRVNRLLPSAEGEAARLAADRAEKHFEREAGPVLVESQRRFAELARQVPADWLQRVSLSTTEEQLSLTLSGDVSDATAGRATRPQLDARHDVSLVVHESAVMELADRYLAGRTISDRDLFDLVQLLTGRAPPSLWVHDRSERWSVVAALASPLAVTFADDAVTIVLRLDRATRSGQTLKCPLELTARYDLARAEEGVLLRRKGEFTVTYVGTEVAKSEQIEWQHFLRHKLSGLFQDEIHFDGLVAPRGGSWGKLRQLQVATLQGRGGWLALAYQLSSRPLAEAPGTRNEVAPKRHPGAGSKSTTSYATATFTQ